MLVVVLVVLLLLVRVAVMVAVAKNLPGRPRTTDAGDCFTSPSAEGALVQNPCHLLCTIVLQL